MDLIVSGAGGAPKRATVDAYHRFSRVMKRSMPQVQFVALCGYLHVINGWGYKAKRGWDAFIMRYPDYDWERRRESLTALMPYHDWVNFYDVEPQAADEVAILTPEVLVKILEENPLSAAYTNQWLELLVEVVSADASLRFKYTPGVVPPTGQAVGIPFIYKDDDHIDGKTCERPHCNMAAEIREEFCAPVDRIELGIFNETGNFIGWVMESEIRWLAGQLLNVEGTVTQALLIRAGIGRLAVHSRRVDTFHGVLTIRVPVGLGEGSN